MWPEEEDPQIQSLQKSKSQTYRRTSLTNYARSGTQTCRLEETQLHADDTCRLWLLKPTCITSLTVFAGQEPGPRSPSDPGSALRGSRSEEREINGGGQGDGCQRHFAQLLVCQPERGCALTCLPGLLCSPLIRVLGCVLGRQQWPRQPRTLPTQDSESHGGVIPIPRQ